MKSIYKLFFKFTFKAYAILIISALMLILPFIILLCQLFLELNLLTYSYIWIAIITLVNVSLLALLAIEIVNKTKGEDSELKAYTKAHMYRSVVFMKIIYICGWTFTINLLSGIFAFVVFYLSANIYIAASYLGAILLIPLFLCLIFLPIFYIVSLKNDLKKTMSICLSACSLVMVCLGTTIIFSKNANNNTLTYDPLTQKYNYTQYKRLDDKQFNNYLAVVQNSSNPQTITKNTNVNFKDNINSSPVFNNFIPTQWLLSPVSYVFQSLIKEVNFNEVSNTNYSIVKVDQRDSYNAQAILTEKNIMNNIFLNVGDQDIFSLESQVLLSILEDYYNSIFISAGTKTLIDLNTKLATMNNISSDTGSKSLSLTEEENILITKLLGMNKDFHQLFYFNFYINNFRDIRNELQKNLEKTTNATFINMIVNMWSNNNWINNFYFKDSITEFSDLKNKYFIPMITDIELTPNEIDIKFLQEEIFHMNNDLTDINFLNQDGIYQNITKAEFNSIFTNINSKQEWENLVLSKSINLKTLSIFYVQIAQIGKIYPMTFTPNAVSTKQIATIQQMQYTTILNNSWVYIVAMLLGSVILWWIVFKSS